MWKKKGEQSIRSSTLICILCYYIIGYYRDDIIIYGIRRDNTQSGPVWTTSRSVTGERVWSARKRKFNFKKPFYVFIWKSRKYNITIAFAYNLPKFKTNRKHYYTLSFDFIRFGWNSVLLRNIIYYKYCRS